MYGPFANWRNDDRGLIEATANADFYHAFSFLGTRRPLHNSKRAIDVNDIMEVAQKRRNTTC